MNPGKATAPQAGCLGQPAVCNQCTFAGAENLEPDVTAQKVVRLQESNSRPADYKRHQTGPDIKR